MNSDYIDKSANKSRAAIQKKAKQKIKFFAEITILTLLMGILLPASVSSSATTSVGVSFGISGTVKSVINNSTILPLHVEGNLIKDSAGNVVVLHGVNKPQMSEDPDGFVLGNEYWTDDKAKTELDGIRSIGANCIRCFQSVDSWVYDLGPNSGTHSALVCAISNRDAVQRLLTFAGQRGMYVIYVPWNVRNGQDSSEAEGSLPYPPYQTSANALQVIPNQQAFVDYWANVASVLKDYPNAIFELWNEPYGNASAEQSWFSVTQQCITAIRNTGAKNLIIVQWGQGCWVNLDYPPAAETLQWVFDYPLTDPTGNLAYSTHIYRHYGSFQRIGAEGGKAYTMSDIQLALQYLKVPEVSALHPLIIGEIGCDNEITGLDYQQELEAYANCLQLLNGYGVGYVGWVWRPNVEFALISDYSPTLTDGGILLANEIVNYTQS